MAALRTFGAALAGRGNRCISQQRSRRKDARVVKSKVQSAVGLDRGANQLLDLLRAAHIGLNEKRRPPFSLDHLNRFAPLRIQVADDNPSAVPGEKKGCGAPDPGAAPGDKRYFVGEIKITTVLSHAWKAYLVPPRPFSLGVGMVFTLPDISRLMI